MDGEDPHLGSFNTLRRFDAQRVIVRSLRPGGAHRVEGRSEHRDDQDRKTRASGCHPASPPAGQQNREDTHSRRVRRQHRLPPDCAIRFCSDRLHPSRKHTATPSGTCALPPRSACGGRARPGRGHPAERGGLEPDGPGSWRQGSAWRSPARMIRSDPWRRP